MRINDYTDYMMHIASQYSPIVQRFAIDILDLREFEQLLRGSNVQALVFLLESYSRQGIKTNIENSHDLISASFLVFDKIQARQVVELKDLHRAEEAAMQIRFRMELDYAMECDVLAGLQVGSFRMEPTGVYANEWAGFRMEYAFAVKEEPILTEGLWPNYTPFKKLR